MMETGGASVERARTRVYRMLEPSCWHAKGLSPVNRIIAGAIVLAAAAAVLESEPKVRVGHERLFLGVEIVFTTLFFVEYCARIWIAGEHARYRGFWGRLSYALTPAALVDLLALSPLLFGVLGGEPFLLRLFRLLRILRLARLGRFSRAFDAILNALRSRRYELLVSAGIAGLLLLVSSTLLYMVEAAGQPEAFGSIPRAMWWSIATLTTVGYGDVAPQTALGQVLAGLTAITGIGLIAMPTGILAAAFSDAIQARRRQSAVSDEGREERERLS
jgi:voltage-gated potassium channel